MSREDMIKNIQDSLDVMESKVCNLTNEINLNRTKDKDTKESGSMTSKSLDDNNLINSKISNEKWEILTNQIQILREQNKNISEDLREWKASYQEKVLECEKYRAKYLDAQQLTEEYRKQIEAFNKSNLKKYEEQANANLMIVNERFKEQYDELGQLTCELESKQLELQDCYSKLRIAEKTVTALSKDLEKCIVKCELQHKYIESEKIKNYEFENVISDQRKEIEDWKIKFDELLNKNQLLSKNIEKMKYLEECLENKTTEHHQLLKQIDSIQEEHSKHVSRIKERAEVQKHSFQIQINGLEQELIQLRANLSETQKEREDIKLHFQNDYIKMEQKYHDAQLEIHNLKSHVEILKQSYTKIVENLEDSSSSIPDNDDYNDNDDDNDDYDKNDNTNDSNIDGHIIKNNNFRNNFNDNVIDETNSIHSGIYKDVSDEDNCTETTEKLNNSNIDTDTSSIPYSKLELDLNDLSNEEDNVNKDEHQDITNYAIEILH